MCSSDLHHPSRFHTLESDQVADGADVDFDVFQQLIDYGDLLSIHRCVLIRFKCMKSAGMVQSMDEFLELFYSEEE